MGKSSLALEIAAELARNSRMTLSDAAVAATPRCEPVPASEAADRGFLPVRVEETCLEPAVS